jgi:DNA-binding cell septation regulator SpoVG
MSGEKSNNYITGGIIMKVTDVRVRLIPSKKTTGVKGFADVDFDGGPDDGGLTIASFPIITTKEGVEFVGVPAILGEDNKVKFYTCKLDKDLRKTVNEKVLDGYRAKKKEEESWD